MMGCRVLISIQNLEIKNIQYRGTRKISYYRFLNVEHYVYIIYILCLI